MLKVNDPFFMYMAEAEGKTNLINTRQSKLNAIIQEVKDYSEDICPSKIFELLLEKYNLTDLTEKELNYIKMKI